MQDITFPFYEVQSFGTTLEITKKLNDALSSYGSASVIGRVLFLCEATGKTRINPQSFKGGDIS